MGGTRTERAAQAEAGDAAERSLVDDLRQLVDDGRTLADAELAYQQSRARLVGGSAGKIAALGGLALVLAFFALMALVFGLVTALTPLLNAWGATAAVVIGLLLLAIAAALVARSRWRRLAGLISEQGPLG